MEQPQNISTIHTRSSWNAMTIPERIILVIIEAAFEVTSIISWWFSISTWIWWCHKCIMVIGSDNWRRAVGWRILVGRVGWVIACWISVPAA